MTTIAADPETLLPEPPPAGGPAWLRARREEAARRFVALGLPTLRDEEWRLTNLEPLRRVAFAPADPAADEVVAGDLDRFRFDGLDAVRVVFVNGHFAEHLSTIDDGDAGVAITRFSEVSGSQADLLEQRLGRCADAAGEAFTALNTACLDDGVLVHVAAGVTTGRPVHVLSLTSSPDRPVATHPRHLVVAEAGSAVTVIEDYAALNGDVYLTNAVTEIEVGDGADVRHYMIERESPAAFNVSSLDVRQGRDSRFASHSVLLGGALVRNNVHPVLAGEGGHSLLNGLYLGGGEQHLDNHMRVEHAAAHCDSRQYYKGILGERAHGVFSGRIVVAKGAQKTDAVQSNANLLLGPSARADAKPQLEIYADDVKCTHGATVGELDDNAVFYLRSRGLAEAAARHLLVYAFAAESLERMDLAPIREAVAGTLMQRLALLHAAEASGA